MPDALVDHPDPGPARGPHRQLVHLVHLLPLLLPLQHVQVLPRLPLLLRLLQEQGVLSGKIVTLKMEIQTKSDQESYRRAFGLLCPYVYL